MGPRRCTCGSAAPNTSRRPRHRSRRQRNPSNQSPRPRSLSRRTPSTSSRRSHGSSSRGRTRRDRCSSRFAVARSSPPIVTDDSRRPWRKVDCRDWPRTPSGDRRRRFDDRRSSNSAGRSSYFGEVRIGRSGRYSRKGRSRCRTLLVAGRNECLDPALRTNSQSCAECATHADHAAKN